jgi:hypothetical protein
MQVAPTRILGTVPLFLAAAKWGEMYPVVGTVLAWLWLGGSLSAGFLTGTAAAVAGGVLAACQTE